MTNRDIIIFTTGVIVGAAAGVLSTMQHFKTKYENFAEERISEVEEYYANKISGNYIGEDNAEINPVSDESTNTGRENGIMSAEQRQEIREKLIDNYKRTSNNAINYSKISTEKFKELRDAAKAEEEIEEPPTMTADEIAAEEHKKNFDKPPYIISVDEYSNLPPHIDTQTLYYYHLNMVVADDNEERIDDYELLIGDCLDESDFANSDEQILFVMNHRLDTAYEIQRVMAAYDEFPED